MSFDEEPRDGHEECKAEMDRLEMHGANINGVFLEDVRALLLALGIGDHSRPISAHQVVHDEIIPAIENLRASEAKWKLLAPLAPPPDAKEAGR